MGNLWQIAVIVVLAAVLLPAANIAYSDQADATTTNESITVQHGETTAVSTDAAVYSDDVDVTRNNQSLAAGEDYQWQSNFGAVYWPENGSTTDGETLQIEYTWSSAGDDTDGVAAIIGSVGWFVWALVLLTVITTLMAWLGLGSGGDW